MYENITLVFTLVLAGGILLLIGYVFYWLYKRMWLNKNNFIHTTNGVTVNIQDLNHCEVTISPLDSISQFPYGRNKLPPYSEAVLFASYPPPEYRK